MSSRVESLSTIIIEYLSSVLWLFIHQTTYAQPAVIHVTRKLSPLPRLCNSTLPKTNRRCVEQAQGATRSVRVRHGIQPPSRGRRHRALDAAPRFLLLRCRGVGFLHVGCVRFLVRGMADRHADADLQRWSATPNSTVWWIEMWDSTHQSLQSPITVVHEIIIKPHHPRLK